MLTKRQYEVRLREVWPAQAVAVNGESLARSDGPATTGWWFDPEWMSVVVRVPGHALRDRVEVVVTAADDAPDEGTLRSGLRGRIAVTKQVAAMIQSPALVTDLGFDVLACLRDGQQIRDAVARFEERWSHLGADIERSTVSRDVKTRALIQWIGLFCKLSVARGQADPKLLTAVMDVCPTTATAGFEGRARLSVDPPWTLTGPHEWPLANVTESKPFVARASLVSRDLPHTGRLRAHLTVESDGTGVTIPIEQVFLPSINAWRVIGPFGAPFAEGLTTAFPPETTIDFDATYAGQDDQDVAWKTVNRKLRAGANLGDEFFIDFDDVFGGRKNNAVAYALCYLTVPEPQEVILALGTDDGVVLWLNDEEIHRVEGGRAYTSKQDRILVRLRAGANKLLMKVHQGGGDWGFCVHVETTDGKPAPNVGVRLSPETAGS